MTPDLSTKIDSIEMKNPVCVASGTFGYGEEFHDSIYDISELGAVFTKGISLAPREGNPVPRVIETSSGMLNAIGLANVGLDVFISEKLPFLVNVGATVIVNIFGSKVADYAAVAERLNSADGVAGIELNISCPNVSAGGVQFGIDPKLAGEVTRAVRDSFSRTLIVKLSPQASDIAEMGKSCVDAGADALSLINTIPAMAVDVEKKKPVLTNVTGGLSGPAIKPVALKAVYDISRAVEVPIIGMGGIMNARDAIEFMLVGASAIQIGTANFVNPNVALEIIAGLKSYCAENGLASIEEIIGAIEV